jgi:hypothetical protein
MKYLTLATLALAALLTTGCLAPEAHEAAPVNMLAVLQQDTIERILGGSLDACEAGHNPDHLECSLPGGRVVAISWPRVSEDAAEGEVYEVIAENTLYKPWFRVSCTPQECRDEAW